MGSSKYEKCLTCNMLQLQMPALVSFHLEKMLLPFSAGTIGHSQSWKVMLLPAPHLENSFLGNIFEFLPL